MKRLLAVLFVAAAATGFVNTVSAETWSPTGPITLSNVGPIFVSGRGGAPASFYCGLSTTGTLNGSSASIGSPGFPAYLWLTDGFSCVSVGFLDQPYNLEPTSLTSVTLQNVRMVDYLGECAGDLVGAFDQATGRITFDNATLPPDPPGSHPYPCLISGVVATTPQASYTIP